MYNDWTIYTPSSSRPTSVDRGIAYSVPLASLPATALRIAFRNRDADEARIIFETDGPVFSPSTIWSHFEFGQEYLLACPWEGGHGVDVDDRPIFCGVLDRIVASGRGRGHSTEFVFLGGWHYLTQYTWQTNVDGHLSSRMTIGGPGITATDQICKILYYAAGLSGNVLASRLYYNVQDYEGVRSYVVLSPNDDSRYVPPHECVDSTCAEAINAILAFFPSAHAWSEFGWVSTSSALTNGKFPFPFIKIGRVLPRSDSSSAATFSSSHLVSYSITKRNDTQCPGVFIQQKQGVTWVNAYRGGNIYNHGDNFLPNGVNSTLEPVANDSGTNQSARFTSETLGKIAGALYNDLSADIPEGKIVLVGREPPGLFDFRPGRRIWLEAIQTASPIQAVEFDVGLGQTTVTFGPPSHLGTQDLVALALANRN